MDETEIKLGSVVRLKSGGPVMTITMIDEDKLALCEWFEKPEGGWDSKSFPDCPLEALEPAKPEGAV